MSPSWRPPFPRNIVVPGLVLFSFWVYSFDPPSFSIFLITPDNVISLLLFFYLFNLFRLLRMVFFLPQQFQIWEMFYPSQSRFLFLLFLFVLFPLASLFIVLCYLIVYFSSDIYFSLVLDLSFSF